MSEPDGMDCPHRQQLEHTLIHCQAQSELLQATRDSYLSIIVEFQRDLEELTEQVHQQQQQQQQEEEQEHQQQQQEHEQQHNDFLLPKDPKADQCELELQNNRLMCRMGCLREKQRNNDFDDDRETQKLREEIAELKQKYSEQSLKVLEVCSLLRTQEDERERLIKTNESAMREYEEQCKELRKANRDLKAMQDRHCKLEEYQEELSKERNVLLKEVHMQREKEAMWVGRERALYGQLKSLQQELDKSRSQLSKMKAHLMNEEREHKDTIDRLCQANEDIRNQMRVVGDECKRMQHKLKVQTRVSNQQQMIIESFRKWKDVQARSEGAMRKCIKRAEEYISMLRTENKRICDEYRRLYSSYTLLEEDFERIRNAVNSRYDMPDFREQPPPVPSQRTAEGDAMSNRLNYMADTTKRLLAQNILLYGNAMDLCALKPPPCECTSEQNRSSSM